MPRTETEHVSRVVTTPTGAREPITATGAQLMARILREFGVEVVAGIPGHTIFPFANAVGHEPGLRSLLVRNEAAAAFAADVYYRVSGRLMAVFTHSFPGAGNVVAAVANAYADSSAMLLIMGETASPVLGRGAYQELSRQFEGDTSQLMRHSVKQIWEPRSADEIVEKTIRAIRTATSGRPGPVGIGVRQEVWEQEVRLPGLPEAGAHLFGSDSRPSAEAVERAAELIRQSERPVLVAGNGVNLARARSELRRFAELTGIPVATTVTGKGAFPENHPLSLGVIGWVGTTPANWCGRNADLIVSIGSRMTESTTSSWVPGVSFDLPGATLIQADIEPLEIGNPYPVDVPLVGDAKATLTDLTAAVEDRGKPVPDTRWSAELAEIKTRWRETVAAAQEEQYGLEPSVGPVVKAVRNRFRDTPVNVVGDVGKSHKWLVQQFEAHDDDYVVSSMGGGTMGIGPSGAIGAALGRPDARTIAWVGDGGMSMSMYAWPTVAEYQLPITYVVIDDNSYGAIANIQEDRFEGNYVYSLFDGSGSNPGYRLNLTDTARACGLAARSVDSAADLEAAVAWAHSHTDEPTVLVVKASRRSEIPNGGGSKGTKPWAEPVHPWLSRRPAVRNVAGDDSRVASPDQGVRDD